MSGDSTAAATGAESTTEGTTATTATSTASTATDDTTDWKALAEKAQADADKWKILSRKNENDLKTERDKAKTATMSADDKATAEAEQRGRQTAAVEYGKKLAAAEFKAAAATAGLDLTEIAGDINTDKFVDDKGDVDEAAIKAAVKRFAKLAPKAAATGASGGEFTGGNGAGQPITEAQMRAMSPADRAKAYAEGKLNHLL